MVNKKCFGIRHIGTEKIRVLATVRAVSVKAKPIRISKKVLKPGIGVLLEKIVTPMVKNDRVCLGLITHFSVKSIVPKQ